MKTFSEPMLLNWPLTPDSTVVEIGSHEGQMIHLLTEKFGCPIIGFEPVPEFYDACVRRFKANPDVVIWPYALGGSNRRASFGIKGSMSGEHCSDSNATIGVPVRDVCQVFDGLGLDWIDLLTLNCEGGEYDILDRLVGSGWRWKIRGLTVQFHATVPGFAARRDSIRGRLTETHECLFSEPFIWEGWKLR